MKQVISVELERELTELEIKVLSIVNELYCDDNRIIDGNEIKQELKRYYEIDMSLESIDKIMTELGNVQSEIRYEHDFLIIASEDNRLLSVQTRIGKNDQNEIVLLEYKVHYKPYFHVLLKHIDSPNNEILKELLD